MHILGLTKPMNKQILIFIILICSIKNSYSQHNYGPRLTAMGKNSAAVNDIWSIEANVAGITSSQHPSIAVNYVNYFFGPEISQQGFAFLLPIKNNYLGISLQRYGITEYNEIKAGFAYAKKFGTNLSIAIKGNYHQIKISNYGATTGFSADVGVMYSLSKQITFGLYLNNPAKQKYTNNSVTNNIPSNISVGASYHASSKILIATSINKQLDNKFDVGFGIDYKLLEIMSLRGGLTMKPFKQYGGIGFNHKKFNVDLAIENDPNLGYSPQIALAYAF